MSEVQRYRWYAPSEAVGEEPARDGEWVRYTDHARRVAELESRLEAAEKDARRYRFIADGARDGTPHK